LLGTLLKFPSWNLSPEGGGNAHVTWLPAECVCLLNAAITSPCHMLTLRTCRTVMTWLGNAPHAGISVPGAKLVCPPEKPSQRATRPPLIMLSGEHRQPQTTNRRKGLVQSTPSTIIPDARPARQGQLSPRGACGQNMGLLTLVSGDGTGFPPRLRFLLTAIIST